MYSCIFSFSCSITKLNRSKVRHIQVICLSNLRGQDAVEALSLLLLVLLVLLVGLVGLVLLALLGLDGKPAEPLGEIVKLRVVVLVALLAIEVVEQLLCVEQNALIFSETALRIASVTRSRLVQSFVDGTDAVPFEKVRVELGLEHIVGVDPALEVGVACVVSVGLADDVRHLKRVGLLLGGHGLQIKK